jgi:hypothetical protein
MRRVCASVAGLALACLAGCTEMPMVKNPWPTTQLKVSSAREWLYIAQDAADSIYNSEAQAGCVVILPPEEAQRTEFLDFLGNAVTKDLVALNDPVEQELLEKRLHKRQVAWNFPPSLLVYTPPDRPGCDTLALKATVVAHDGARGYPAPGAATLLATGVVVIRNVAKAFSEASAIGAVAAGEAAFWASSGFHPGATSTEISIQVVRTDQDSRVIADYIDVYYINSGDARLYQPADLPRQKTASTGGGVPIREPEPVCLDPSSYRCLAARHIKVTPETISACDPTATFTLSGARLSTSPQDYHFGPIEADAAERLHGSHDLESVRVAFSKLQQSNKGLDPVPLSIARTDGTAASVHINVDGTPPDCKKPATGVANTPSPAQSANPKITLAPNAGKPGDSSDVCKLPLVLQVGGADAGKLTGATIDTEVSQYEAQVEMRRRGKTVAVTITFDTLPNFANGPPNSIKVSLQVGAKSTSEQIPVSCAQPAPGPAPAPAPAPGPAHAPAAHPAPSASLAPAPAPAPTLASADGAAPANASAGMATAPRPVTSAAQQPASTH